MSLNPDLQRFINAVVVPALLERFIAQRAQPCGMTGPRFLTGLEPTPRSTGRGSEVDRSMEEQASESP